MRILHIYTDEQLPKLYRQANLFVLPANCRAEAFGTVLLEAMTSGLPCITTEVGSGTSWVVQHGESGLVVPSGDVESMVSSIRKVLDHKELHESMSSTALKRARSEFTFDLLSERVLELYRNCREN